MTLLESTDEIGKAFRTFSEIFVSTDTFSDPFRPLDYEKTILYPFTFELDEDEYEKIRIAALSVGDDKAYITDVERMKNLSDFNNTETCMVDLDQYPYKYTSNEMFPLMTENSIYSVNSKWGILISNEQHILIGGKKPFIEKILTLFPDYDERLSDFLGLWQDYKNEFDTDISWIQTILGRFRFTNN